MPNIQTKPKDINSVAEYEFDSESSLYLIKISASVLGEQQNIFSKTNDQDAVVKINNIEFPKTVTKNRLIDSPASFSGGTQKGKIKHLYFILKLKKGKNKVQVTPQYNAKIHQVSYSKLTSKNDLIELEVKKQAKDLNRQPFITLTTVDLALVKLTFSCEVKWHFLDGDDVKTIINNKTVETKGRRKDWLVKATPNLPRQPKKVFKEIPLENSNRHINYIEFWADKSPTIDNITLEFDGSIKKETIQKYLIGDNNEDYNKYDEDILEAVNRWNTFFFAQKYPPSEPLDPNLVKAMCFIESRLGYGSSPTGHPAFPDIMQIGNDLDGALNYMRNGSENEAYTGQIEPVVYDIPEIELPKDSLYWGTRWLYHKVQVINEKNITTWLDWKSAVRKYGPTNVYEYSVWNLYTKGAHPNGKDKVF